MLEYPTSFSFVRYLRLYTLHSIEQSSTNKVYLQARVATLQYVLKGLPKALDRIWQQDTESGITHTQDIVMLRFEELLDEEDIWQAIQQADEEVSWKPYWSLRQAAGNVLPTVKSLIPPPPAPRSIVLYSQNKWMQRVYQAERWLDLTRKTIEVANLGFQLWQQWKLGREQRRLLQEQRLLLKDSMQANLIGQQQALVQASDPSFVQQYLLEHGDDEIYDVLFDDDLDGQE